MNKWSAMSWWSSICCMCAALPVTGAGELRESAIGIVLYVFVGGPTMLLFAIFASIVANIGKFIVIGFALQWAVIWIVGMKWILARKPKKLFWFAPVLAVTALVSCVLLAYRGWGWG